MVESDNLVDVAYESEQSRWESGIETDDVGTFREHGIAIVLRLDEEQTD